MSPILSLKKVNKYFDDGGKKLHVLKDIDLEVIPNEFVMLLGPSGSGKSTLLRVIAGLESYESGELFREPSLRLSFVFQSFALFPWLTVYENIEFGLKMAKVKFDIRRKTIHGLIEEIGLTAFAHTHPKELSGGMKQRVGIARALAVSPDIILLDEPFSALDSFTASILRQELLSIWQKRKLTLVMVTHLIEEALTLGDRTVLLTPVPARVEANRKNPLPRPRDRRSAEFFTEEDAINKIIKV